MKAVTKVFKKILFLDVVNTLRYVSKFLQTVSAAVAQFLRLSDFELHSILRLFCEEEEREVQLIKNKY